MLYGKPLFPNPAPQIKGELKLNTFPQVTRRAVFLFAGCSICLLSIVAIVALSGSLKTHSQEPSVPSKLTKDSLLKFVENSPELPLKVAGNENCPFRIIQATVKEISGSDFSRLTGRTTDQVTVASVPEVRLVNTSEQTITEFILLVRDPQSRASRGFVQQKISIGPGETYLVKREHFVAPEKQTIARANEPVRHILSQPNLESEKYWLQFATPPSEMFVTVGQLTFSNGTTWMIREEGDVR